MIFGPWFAPVEVPTGARLVFSVLGGILFAVGSLVVIITKLYVKASAEKAYVRTGMGKAKVIMDGGSLVIPVVHTLIWVPLRTFKLEVMRQANDALITGDKLRADIKAEFYIKVQANDEDITQAARSLGERSVDEHNLTGMMMEKLVSAIRSVAAKSTLEELNSDKATFAQSVATAVSSDLKHNGFTLETVTISSLDQTPINFLKEDNVFDAEGRKRIADITSQAKVAENQFRRTAEQQIAEQDTLTRTKVAEQEYLQNKADAERDANIKKTQAEQLREAEVYSAQQTQQTKEAQILAEQNVGLKEAEKVREVQLAQIGADQAAKTASVELEKTVEVANRRKQIAIAAAEKERADAEALKLTAEQAREKENQGVITVQEVATAERDKQVKVIAAMQDAEVQKTDRNMQADIAAYQVEKQADAERNAATKNAEAIRVEAEARKDAKVMEATGEQAVMMVPVNVSAEQVAVDAKRQNEVEKARVDVLQQELSAKSEHEKVSIELETTLATLRVLEAIGVEGAKAYGASMSSAHIQVFGDTETLGKINKSFYGGLGAMKLLEGVIAGDGESPVGQIGDMLGGLIRRVKAGDTAGLIEKVQELAAENPELVQALISKESAEPKIE